MSRKIVTTVCFMHIDKSLGCRYTWVITSPLNPPVELMIHVSFLHVSPLMPLGGINATPMTK